MIKCDIFNPKDIERDILKQYIQINKQVYPDFAANIDLEKLERKLKHPNQDKIILAMDKELLVGWLMVSYAESHELYHFNMLVHGDYHHQGIGTELLKLAKEQYNELYGVVVPVNEYQTQEGKMYLSPLEFYEKNGFIPTGRKFVEYGNVELVEIKWFRF